uniref:ATGSL07 (Glucan synthase-like 7) n=1 Tax=Arundo donax TaxID=35708 RepID=A0A0A8YCN3_ARUDO
MYLINNFFIIWFTYKAVQNIEHCLIAFYYSIISIGILLYSLS